MKKTPVFLESGKGESGAICLAMILGYFKSFPKLNVVKNACSCDGNEITPENLYQACLNFGVTAKQTSQSIEKISLDSPIIIRLKSDKYVLVSKKNQKN